MRVARVEIENHPGVGNVEVNFLNADGTVPRQVVVAGQNGCGKTSILNAIHRTLSGSDSNLSIGQSTIVRVYISGPPGVLLTQAHYPLKGTVNQKIADFVSNNPDFVGGVLDNNGNYASLPDKVYRNNAGAQFYYVRDRSFFSKASLNFDVPQVGHSQVYADKPKGTVPVRLSRAETLLHDSLATEIAQLLVNLDAADNMDLHAWVDDHPGEVVPGELKHKRLGRFAAAFATLMPDKRLKAIRPGAGTYDPIFVGPGGETRLVDLSTGEKQVVFRGAFLLRSIESLPGAVVLIDEPELSLHPDWQSQVADFYDNIVPNDPDEESQIIFATHSPFVVHGSPTAKHVILRRDDTGQVTQDPTPSYPGVTPGDVAVAAFDLESYMFARPGNKMVVVTEGWTDAAILKRAWETRRPGPPMPFNLMPAHGAKSVQIFLGAEPNKMGPLMDALSDQRVDRCLALFDFDHDGFDQWKGMIKPKPEHCEFEDLAAPCAYRKRRGAAVWAALLPCPPFRSGYAGFGAGLGNKSRLTIELLFENAVVGQYLQEEEIAGAPGVKAWVAPESQKRTIAEAAASFQAADFAAFEPILQRIEAILALP